MDKKKVIVLADIYDSFPDLDIRNRQEWESKKSIDYLLNTILELGHDPILIEPKKSKLTLIESIKSILEDFNIENTILFNLVEGFKSRNRESYVPAFGEFFGIPFTGSDAYAQSISLDKFLTKLIVKQLGIPTKNSQIVHHRLDTMINNNYPLFVKPNGEGSSLGIGENNIAMNRKELESILAKLLLEFGSILIEEFLEGEDLTLGVFGNYPNYFVSSVAKLTYPSKIYSEEIKSKDSMPETLAFSMEKNLEKKIQKDSIEICKTLQVEGYARLDWKCDAIGNPFFLEINLTPGLSRYYSSLPICFEANFGKYSDLIKNILQFGYENYNTNKIFDYGKLEKK